MRDDTHAATQRLLTLGQFPGLAGTELGELAMIADNVVEASFAAGATVAAPSPRLPGIHLVVDGRIVAAGPAGAVMAWGPRSVFGAVEVLAGRGVASPAIAAAPTRTLALSAADFAEVLEDNYNLLTQIRRRIARQLIELGIAHSQVDVGARGKVYFPARVPSGPLGMVDKLILIRHQAPFALGKIQALALLAQAAEEIDYAAGDVLTRAGDRADGALILVEGNVLATRAGVEPRVLGAGNAVGRIETLAEDAHTLTVEALGPVRALRCPGGVLFDALEDHTDLGLAMVSTLSGELLDVAARLDPTRAQWGAA
jgi:CRP-like cAMP-binding protein